MSTIQFFLPGPTYVAEDVRQAMDAPDIGHRSQAYKDLHASVAGKLKAVFRTRRDVVPLAGSASLAMEMAVTSLVERDVLNLVCGAFSERWAKISKAHGKAADRVEVPWGQVVDPDLVRRALWRKKYEAITVVHNETSTGVLNPLKEIAEVVREESDALICVDAVSSMAGAELETDAWGLDFVLTGSQKALAMPPGLAFACPSERAEKKAAEVTNRGFYTDLLGWLDKHRADLALTTPPIPQLRAADVALGRIVDEGLPERWQRHLEMRQRTAAWAGERGLEYASAEAGASPTVSCLKLDDAPKLVQALAADGWVVGGGYGQWKPSTFRIGHMGEVRMDDLEALLAKIDTLLGDTGLEGR